MNNLEAILAWVDNNRLKTVSILLFIAGLVASDLRVIVAASVLFIAISEVRRGVVVTFAKEHPVIAAMITTFILYVFVPNGWILVASALGCLAYLMHKNQLWGPVGEVSKKVGGLVWEYTPNGVKVFIFGFVLCVLATVFKSYGHTGTALILGFLGAAICWGVVFKGFGTIGKFFAPVVSPLVDTLLDSFKPKKSAEEKKNKILKKIEEMKIKAGKERDEADWKFLCKIEAMVDKGAMSAEAADIAIRKRFRPEQQEKKKKS